MALPIQKAPKYTCVLPISGIEVRYRPFLMKEQSHMMLTRESEDPKEIFTTTKELVKAVTEGKVDASKLPMTDLEYLFLQIRIKSVGETAKIPWRCKTETCDNVVISEVDLESIEVDTSEMQDNKIQISDELIVELSPPTSKLMASIDLEKDDELSLIKPILRNSMVRLYDEENVYEMADHRDSEIDEFIESLSMKQFEKISEWFQSIPVVLYEEEYTCPKCKETHTGRVQGIQNFF